MQDRSTDIPQEKRKRRKRDRVRGLSRRLRARVAHYRLLFQLAAVAAVALALTVVGLLAFDRPEPVSLGTGRAGIKALDTARVAAAPPDTAARPAPPETTAAPPRAGRDLGQGQASYYGEELAGRSTASGERFDPARLTAAHRTLPLGSRVRVTSVRTGRSVIVRINDRGPFAKRRVIDLSKAAARQIGLLSAGVGRVRMELLPA